MKRGIIKALSLVLCAAMLFGIAAAAGRFVQAQAAGATTGVSFDVTFHQSDARSILPMINELRLGDDAWYWNSDNTARISFTGQLSALVYDYELEEVAMQRAAELIVKFAHTRPDGTDAGTMFTFDSRGENIAAGNALTAESVQTSWEEEDKLFAGQSHRRVLLNKHITAVGIACAEYEGFTYWVQEFRSPASNKAATPALDGTATVTVETANALVKSSTVTAVPESMSLEAGKSKSLPVISQKIEYVEDSIKRPSFINSIVNNNVKVTWESSDSSVVQISGNKAVGKKAGNAILTGTFAGGETVLINATVTGSSTPDDPDEPDEPDTPDKPDISSAVINAPYGTRTVNWKYKAHLTASANNLPDGYKVIWYEGSKPVSKDGEYTSGNLTSQKTYTAKIVDKSGNPVSSEAQEKTVVVEVKSDFITKIVSFFSRLFGSDVVDIK